MAFNKKPNQTTKYHQGYYQLKNPNKYIGMTNQVVYRSGWEYKFMQICDCNPRILRWGSETLSVPYLMPTPGGTMNTHRYYPDFYLEILINQNDPNSLQRWVLEIKPKKEIARPELPKKNTLKALQSYEYQAKLYEKNVRKWVAADEWCTKNQMQFILFHEDMLNEVVQKLHLVN